MSEFTNHRENRMAFLLELFHLIIRGEMNSAAFFEAKQTIELVEPSDIINVVDQLVQLSIPMSELKKGINKGLNLLHKSLEQFPYNAPFMGSFLNILIQNNQQIDIRLKNIRPLIAAINLKRENPALRKDLIEKLTDLSRIDLHYQIKENVLFPQIEKYLPDYRCLQVMWSFHDDIRRNLKIAIELMKTSDFDLQQFNRLMGDLFFNIYAIIFREERILFPIILNLIPESVLDALIDESLEIGFPYIQAEAISGDKKSSELEFLGDIDLKTGYLSAEQIRLIFNHLPVDITYVDENNKVKFFSTPEKRIFRRTNSIIGRDVKNCHPHESVHVVEQIVESFKSGEKDKASFWIQMKGELILIQYFAVRDENRKYMGVVEVSQEITEIRSLQGENRLLDWTS